MQINRNSLDDWLVEHRETAISALTALSNEPLSLGEQRRLGRLIDAIKAGSQADTGSLDPAALASRLSSYDFSWLPPFPAVHRGTAQGQPAPLPVTTSQLLQAVAESIRPLRDIGVNAGTIYLLLLIGFSWIVVVGLSFTAIPSFQFIFDDFQITVPFVTRLLLGISQFIAAGGWLAIPLIILLAVTVWLLMATRYPAFRNSLRPALRQRGGTPDLHGMAQFCRSLADASNLGLPFAEAIRWAGSRCGHLHLESDAMQLAEHARQDHNSLQHNPAAKWFPANLFIAFSYDQQSTPTINSPLLRALAEIYEQRAAERGEEGITLFSIFVVLGVFLVIGFTAISLFLPLIQIITGLS